MVGVTLRLKNGTYTDADVLALYMKYRERAAYGSFVREVGDFIAHENRDRGTTFEATVYHYSQWAFWYVYLSPTARQLMPIGQCGWWLKPFLLGKVRETPEKQIKKATGLNRKKAINEIMSWFDSKSDRPTKINCQNKNILYALCDLFSRKIKISRVFETENVIKEILDIFRKEYIPDNELNNFIIASLLILKNKKCGIVPGVTLSLQLIIEEPRSFYEEEIILQSGRKIHNPIPLDGGKLSILTKIDNNNNDGLVNALFPLLQTDIDTDLYFDNSTKEEIEINNSKIFHLNLERNFMFDRASTPMVRLAEY